MHPALKVDWFASSSLLHEWLILIFLSSLSSLLPGLQVKAMTGKDEAEAAVTTSAPKSPTPHATSATAVRDKNDHDAAKESSASSSSAPPPPSSSTTTQVADLTTLPDGTPIQITPAHAAAGWVIDM